MKGHLKSGLSGIPILEVPAVPKHKKIFFASDFHLGHLRGAQGRTHEQQIIQWLNEIEPTAHALFLLGDIFDFWFEYQHVIPKGFVRLQHKLATLTANNIPVYFLLGNRDCWAKDYLEQELGLKILQGNTLINTDNKKILIGHGDELSGKKLYKLLKKYIYQSQIIRSIVNILPPALTFRLAQRIIKGNNSNRSQIHSPQQDLIFEHCKNILAPQFPCDYYVFGHLHHPYSRSINSFSTYYNLGDWVHHYTYGTFDGEQFTIENFPACSPMSNMDM